jgi:hypothetical protein
VSSDTIYRLKPKEPVKRRLYVPTWDGEMHTTKAIGLFDPDTNKLIDVELEK